MRCRYVNEKGVRFFLPECWGGVMHGPQGCYCSTKKDDLYEEFEKLKQRVAVLEKELARISRAGE